MAAKKPSNPDKTASLASKVLSNPQATRNEKSLAGSVLVQTYHAKGREPSHSEIKQSAAGKVVGKSGITKELAASALSQRIVKAPAKPGSLSKSTINAAIKSVSGSMTSSGKKSK